MKESTADVSSVVPYNLYYDNNNTLYIHIYYYNILLIPGV